MSFQVAARFAGNSPAAPIWTTTQLREDVSCSHSLSEKRLLPAPAEDAPLPYFVSARLSTVCHSVFTLLCASKLRMLCQAFDCLPASLSKSGLWVCYIASPCKPRILAYKHPCVCANPSCAFLRLPLLVRAYLSRLWKLCVDGGQRNKWCKDWDSLDCEVDGYRGTLADPDTKGSERPEDSELGHTYLWLSPPSMQVEHLSHANQQSLVDRWLGRHTAHSLSCLPKDRAGALRREPCNLWPVCTGQRWKSWST